MIKDKKGITAKLLLSAFIFLMVLSFLVANWQKIKDLGVQGFDGLRGETGNFGLPGNTLLEGDTTCTDDVAREDYVQLIRKASQNTLNPEINPDFALAIAWRESTLRHCDGDEVLEAAEGSTGVMQLYPSTVKETCTGMDITVLEQNIACGLKIMQTKYVTVRDDEDFERIVTNNLEEDGCPEYKDKYLGYLEISDPDRKLWAKVARAYNGLSCPPNVVSENYADKVLEFMESKPWEEI